MASCVRATVTECVGSGSPPIGTRRRCLSTQLVLVTDRRSGDASWLAHPPATRVRLPNTRGTRLRYCRRRCCCWRCGAGSSSSTALIKEWKQHVWNRCHRDQTWANSSPGATCGPVTHLIRPTEPSQFRASSSISGLFIRCHICVVPLCFYRFPVLKILFLAALGANPRSVQRRRFCEPDGRNFRGSVSFRTVNFHPPR